MNQIKQYTKADLNFIEIDNKQSNFRVVLVDFGASLYEMWFHNELMTPQIVEPNDFYKEVVRFGKTLGRVSGRMENSQITVDGKVYQLQNNNNGHCLHGGHDCLAQRRYKLLSVDNKQDKTTVVYEYVSPDGEGGWPGNLTSKVTYEISTTEPSIKVIYDTVCDHKSPISIATHLFISLGDSDIYNQKLYINADRYIHPRSKDLIPIEIRPVPECLDFRTMRNVNESVNDPLINEGCIHGYDHYFLFKEVNPNKAQLQLENDRYHLDVFTDFEGTTIYSDNNGDDIICQNTKVFVKRGLGMEPQVSHVADIMTPANKPIHHWMEFKFSKI